MSRVFAVIVTYQPDAGMLARLVAALAPQVSGGIVVNNADQLPLSAEHLQSANFAVRHMASNTGVATALNAGFQWAQMQIEMPVPKPMHPQDVDFVITFDQDSEPAADMVSRLVLAYQNLVASGQKVGAVGPQQVDRRTGRRAPFLAPIARQRRRVVPESDQPIEVDHLITSGCLVPIHVWRAAGPFLDELFIDYVDIEWSLRLRHQGWHLFGIGGATLTHAIGDKVAQWWGWQFPWHSPLRHYFIFRNGTYLQKLPHVSLGWKLFDALQLAKKLVIFTLVGRPRAAHLGAMLRGVRDGWRGRLGP
jgi:rhamnosyltransferase